MGHVFSYFFPVFFFFSGLACLGPLTVEQTLWPRADSLTRRIYESREAAVAKRNVVGVNEANQCILALLVSWETHTHTHTDC